jgi:hypothetical protein
VIGWELTWCDMSAEPNANVIHGWRYVFVLALIADCPFSGMLDKRRINPKASINNRV